MAFKGQGGILWFYFHIQVVKRKCVNGILVEDVVCVAVLLLWLNGSCDKSVITQYRSVALTSYLLPRAFPCSYC